MAHEEREDRLGLLPEDIFAERGGWPRAEAIMPPSGYYGGGADPVQAPGITVPYDDSQSVIPFQPPPVNPKLLAATRRQGSFLTVPFTAGTEIKLIREEETRLYFFIQNTSAAGDLYVGFGSPPIPGSSLILSPGAAFEPYQVPTNTIYTIGTAPGMKGILILAVEGDV